MFTNFKNILSEKEHGFTLIELIVVIIIVGILAAVGLTQYSLVVEKSRVAEARVRIGAMSKLAYEYYLSNGTFVGISNDDLGIDGTCYPTDYYRYVWNVATASSVSLYAYRCTAGGGGKPPAGPAYILRWQVNQNGSLLQEGYFNAGGSWVITSNWGGCCR
ncbi:MAG: prepilin-type N-terminal cleavage/methylation domain-containing protein [Candidatus Omnitrophica bacterium]|nr:prepilin-type N-terminal cleavage/methylation domain-containing protein [Candidatus Omnitrophota bacterium]